MIALQWTKQEPFYLQRLAKPASSLEQESVIVSTYISEV